MCKHTEKTQHIQRMSEEYEPGLVSVIIPTYNRANLVGQAIQSVLEQTYQNFEIIVVDDGSTDDTKQALAPYKDKITYIYQQNQGGSAARNTGIKASSGQYIALLDSDDVWFPEKLSKQVKKFKKGKNNLGLVYCGVQGVKNGRVVFEDFPTKKGKVGDVILKSSSPIICGGGSCSLILRKVLVECGLFDETNELRIGGSQDQELWIRITDRYEIDFVEGFFVTEFVGHNSITSFCREHPYEKGKSLLYILEKHKALFNEHPMAHSLWLREISDKLLITGLRKEARKHLLKAIILAPYLFSNYVYLINTCFGRNFYRISTKLRKAVNKCERICGLR